VTGTRKKNASSPKGCPSKELNPEKMHENTSHQLCKPPSSQ
jgi:hypothetical protein